MMLMSLPLIWLKKLIPPDEPPVPEAIPRFPLPVLAICTESPEAIPTPREVLDVTFVLLPCVVVPTIGVAAAVPVLKYNA